MLKINILGASKFVIKKHPGSEISWLEGMCNCNSDEYDQDVLHVLYVLPVYA